MKFLDRLQDKIELYRLEQKYARRKNRTTYTTGAQYVDGEYVYSANNNNNNTSSPSSSKSSSATSSPITPQSSPSRNTLASPGRGVMSAMTGQNTSHRNSRLWGR